ncbi:hypothetical protein RF11_01758 [Thelohanellus kitauei]|uniref:Uncharacterized protein n=1 Tax=Thelohanellus kitauei TaxID=669202 RepID=A0A0C2N1F0_THEKT|nr:hypothetical protein RF11_01758 [Thelohanellus kitauei]
MTATINPLELIDFTTPTVYYETRSSSINTEITQTVANPSAFVEDTSSTVSLNAISRDVSTTTMTPTTINTQTTVLSRNNQTVSSESSETGTSQTLHLNSTSTASSIVTQTNTDIITDPISKATNHLVSTQNGSNPKTTQTFETLTSTTGIQGSISTKDSTMMNIQSTSRSQSGIVHSTVSTNDEITTRLPTTNSADTTAEGLQHTATSVTEQPTTKHTSHATEKTEIPTTLKESTKLSTQISKALSSGITLDETTPEERVTFTTHHITTTPREPLTENSSKQPTRNVTTTAVNSQISTQASQTYIAHDLSSESTKGGSTLTASRTPKTATEFSRESNSRQPTMIGSKRDVNSTTPTLSLQTQSIGHSSNETTTTPKITRTSFTTETSYDQTLETSSRQLTVIETTQETTSRKSSRTSPPYNMDTVTNDTTFEKMKNTESQTTISSETHSPETSSGRPSKIESSTNMTSETPGEASKTQSIYTSSIETTTIKRTTKDSQTTKTSKKPLTESSANQSTMIENTSGTPFQATQPISPGSQSNETPIESGTVTDYRTSETSMVPSRESGFHQSTIVGTNKDVATATPTKTSPAVSTTSLINETTNKKMDDQTTTGILSNTFTSPVSSRPDLDKTNSSQTSDYIVKIITTSTRNRDSFIMTAKNLKKLSNFYPTTTLAEIFELNISTTPTGINYTTSNKSEDIEFMHVHESTSNSILIICFVILLLLFITVFLFVIFKKKLRNEQDVAKQIRPTIDRQVSLSSQPSLKSRNSMKAQFTI